MRTKERAAGTLSELATATKMWRPAVVSGARGKERRAPALRQGRWRRSRATRGQPALTGGGLPAGPERRRHGTEAAIGKAEKQAGGGRRLDFFVISENSRDLTIKLK